MKPGRERKIAAAGPVGLPTTKAAASTASDLAHWIIDSISLIERLSASWITTGMATRWSPTDRSTSRLTVTVSGCARLRPGISGRASGWSLSVLATLPTSHAMSETADSPPRFVSRI